MKSSFVFSVASAAALAALLACLIPSRARLLAEGERPALAVEIAVPEIGGKRVIPCAGEFHVVVTNASSEHMAVYSQACVEGRSQLCFEIADESGNAWTLLRKPENVRRNVRVTETLAPGEPMVIHVDFSSPVWNHPAPWETLKGRKLSIRAVFDGSAARSGGVASITGGIDSKGGSVEPDSGPGSASETGKKPESGKLWTGKTAMYAARIYTIE